MKTTTERKSYLICINSDSCVIDSMNVKHTRCFGPAFIKVWYSEEEQESILKRWNEVNLYSPTRGINRFKGLTPLLQELPLTGPASDTQRFVVWVEIAPKLSNDALRAVCSFTEINCMFEKALRWSLWVSELIRQFPTSAPFSPVLQCLKTTRQEVDIAVVSSANVEVIHTEWGQDGLLNDVSCIFSQSNGSKAQYIKKILQMGYQPDHVLMVEDAPGGYDATSQNQVWFYPIPAGKEESSRQQLTNSYPTKLFHNELPVELQLNLLNDMKRNPGIS